MTTIRTLTLTLAVLFMAIQPTEGSWGNVRKIPTGTRVKVRMSDSQSQNGYRIAKGRFESADEQTLVLFTNGNNKGQTLTLQKAIVEEIRVRIPPVKRRMPWIITGSIGAITLIVLPYVPFVPGGIWGGGTPHIFALFGLVSTGSAAALTFGRGNMKAVFPVTRFDMRKIQSRQPIGKLTSPPTRKLPNR